MTEPLTIQQLLDWGTAELTKHHFEWPHLEAEILLAYALGIKRIELYTKHDQIVSPDNSIIFLAFLQRRLKHEPTAYITGYQPFMSLDFIVDRSVLIPRPETELLVETVIDTVKKLSVVSCSPDVSRDVLLVDLGTGSGCIAVSLAKYLPNVKVIGIDNSPAAIEIARRNAVKHGVQDLCEFNVAATFRSPFPADLIISNPPYIPTANIANLMPDVRDWEPHQALDGGADGLDFIRQLIAESPQYAKHLIFEFGDGQAEKIKELAHGKFQEIKIIKDNAGKERVFSGCYKSWQS